MATDSQIVEVMRLLRIAPTDFACQSEEQLQSLKQAARKRLGIIAKEYHPDRTSNRRKIDLFTAATRIVEDIEQTEYVQPRRRRRRRFRYSVKVG